MYTMTTEQNAAPIVDKDSPAVTQLDFVDGLQEGGQTEQRNFFVDLQITDNFSQTKLWNKVKTCTPKVTKNLNVCLGHTRIVLIEAE